MNISRSLALAILSSAVTSTAFASDNWYLGALYNSQDYAVYGRHFNTAGLVAGYEFNQYFSLEGRYGVGTSGYETVYDITEDTETSYKEDIDTQYSLFIKGSYPIDDSLSIYGLVGYSETDLEVNGYAQFVDENALTLVSYPIGLTQTDKGLSYGLGLSYKINAKFSIFADYQVLPDFEPTPDYSRSWKSKNIGISYKF